MQLLGKLFWGGTTLAGCAALDLLHPLTCEWALVENDWTRHGHCMYSVQEADEYDAADVGSGKQSIG
jgi:hypothetical protein